MEQIPYGAWPSPLSAADVAAVATAPSWPGLVDGEVWWSESRPAEGGRLTVVRATTDGPQELLPAPWNARTRAQEYGGRSWVVAGGALVFAHFADQRLYRMELGGEPVAITAEGGGRFAELTVVGSGSDTEVWCVRERGGSERDLVAVPLAGGEPRVLRTDRHFLAGLRLSPDGGQLAWIGWDHPNMPWDGTELRVAPVEGAEVGEPRTVLGGPDESVLQPEWRPDGTLVALTDRSGWWNPVDVATGEPLRTDDSEIGGPLWVLGLQWYAVRADGSLVCAGEQLTTADGTVLHPGHWQQLASDGRDVVAVETPADAPPRVVRLRADDTVEVVHAGTPAPVGPEWVSTPVRRTFPSAGGRVVHTVVSPPLSPVAEGPAGTRPPYVAFVHGGPTAAASAAFSLTKTYFTSRGIGVVDVDYGGSTGYGRAYRDALRGQWGVVDVEDTAAAVRGLAEAGEADPAALLIRGGSAGGWTVLAALTRTDAFAAGASYFGVTDARGLAEDTHDFESRYMDSMIGPLPEAADVYAERSPMTHVDGLSCPVLLLQGSDDKIVLPAQAETFVEALAAKGLPHAYLLFEGEGHGFRDAANIVAATEGELSFYGQVLGFDPPGVPVLPLTRG